MKFSIFLSALQLVAEGYKREEVFSKYIRSRFIEKLKSTARAKFSVCGKSYLWSRSHVEQRAKIHGTVCQTTATVSTQPCFRFNTTAECRVGYLVTLFCLASLQKVNKHGRTRDVLRTEPLAHYCNIYVEWPLKLCFVPNLEGKTDTFYVLYRLNSHFCQYNVDKKHGIKAQLEAVFMSHFHGRYYRRTASPASDSTKFVLVSHYLSIYLFVQVQKDSRTRGKLGPLYFFVFRGHEILPRTRRHATSAPSYPMKREQKVRILFLCYSSTRIVNTCEPTGDPAIHPRLA